MNMKFIKDDGNERKNPAFQKTLTTSNQMKSLFARATSSWTTTRPKKHRSWPQKRGFTSMPMQKPLSSYFENKR